MKNLLFLSLFIFFGTIGFSQKAEKFKTIIIQTSAECGDCKERIENAADIKGVKTSNWNKDKKVLTVIFDTIKVSLTQIEEAIAKIGYATSNKLADSKAYKKLPECCQYEKGACKETK
jgi:copper chaperone CopZ